MWITVSGNETRNQLNNVLLYLRQIIKKGRVIIYIYDKYSH